MVCVLLMASIVKSIAVLRSTGLPNSSDASPRNGGHVAPTFMNLAIYSQPPRFVLQDERPRLAPYRIAPTLQLESEIGDARREHERGARSQHQETMVQGEREPFRQVDQLGLRAPSEVAE